MSTRFIALSKYRYLIGWTLWLCCLLPMTSSAQAFADNEASLEKYRRCRELYESEKFLTCFTCCEELKTQLGGTNPRVLSLLVRSGINILPLGIIGKETIAADQQVKLNYKNLSKVHGYVQELAQLLDPNDSLNRNYIFAKEYLALLEWKMKDFAEEKERTPEKAIAFLNSCAQKFKKHELTEDYNKVEFFFQLLQDTLLIEMKCRSWNSKPKFRSAHIAQMKIPLKEVWIEKRNVRYWPDEIYLSYPFVPPPSAFTTTSTDPAAPVITSTITTTGNKILYDKLLARGTRDYNKDMNYPYDELEKYYRNFEPREHPLYLYYFFNSSALEFKEGNYRKRIEDTFTYLIEHFGGGERRTKTQKSSPF